MAIGARTPSRRAAILVDGAHWPGPDGLGSIQEELADVADHVEKAGGRALPALQSLPEHQRASGLNLRHYLALRSREMRPLQTRLAALGLSSLGRTESHMQWSLEAVLRNLRLLSGQHPDPARPAPTIGYDDGARLLARHSERLLGPAPDGRAVRIMVTMPTEAASDRQLVANLLAAGMDCARINSAHDGPEVWRAMIANIRAAASTLDRECPVLMDMAGPKLRTGDVTPGPPVIRVKPRRDDFGRVVSVARVWLAPCDQPPPASADAHVPVSAEWAGTLLSGDLIRFTDTRNDQRTWIVDTVGPAGAWANVDRTAYLTTGAVLHRVPPHRRAGDESDLDATVGPVPHSEGFLLLRVGDRLLVTRDLSPGTNAVRGRDDAEGVPARIGCTLSEVFADVRPGERIWFDDGKIGGLIEAVTPDELTVAITQASERGQKLRGGKGINLPDCDLHVRALGADDLASVGFAVEHADLIGLSFVHDPADVRELIGRIERGGARKPGIVLKIETKRGFEALPSLLREALAAPAAGVMIARGDLAVECGYERLAEIQEEILWLSEAAHVPVIWATQVLETLAQTGRPSRAEITDAAMGQRAECVMLNKGPHIVEAVQALDDILRRMQDHQRKKQTLLRQLSSWTTADD